MKRNNALQKNHFKKKAIRYRTWFNQPARALRRKKERKLKEKKIAPNPLKKLRPIVRCPSIRHNKFVRMGRGFTPEECREAGLDYKYARTIGISVDERRVNQNKETFDYNVNRIREYLSKIKIYKSQKEAKEDGAVQHRGEIMPVQRRENICVPVITKDEITNLA